MLKIQIRVLRKHKILKASIVVSSRHYELFPAVDRVFHYLVLLLLPLNVCHCFFNLVVFLIYDECTSTFISKILHNAVLHCILMCKCSCTFLFLFYLISVMLSMSCIMQCHMVLFSGNDPCD